jgi:uncharacterized glyoxalase superfamily protein PhnB
MARGLDVECSPRRDSSSFEIDRLLSILVNAKPSLTGVYIFSRSLAETIAFYRLLGFEIEELGPDFARARVDAGPTIEFGTAAITRSYDPGWQESTGPATNTLRIDLGSRDAVDAKYRELTAAGYRGHLAPIDAPWRERFALVDDPDGNVIGLHSPPAP